MNEQHAAPSGSRAHQVLAPAAFEQDGRLMQAQPCQQQQGGGGKGGGSPPPAPAPVVQQAPPPTIEDTDAKQQDQEAALLRRKGALASNVTGPQGAATPETQGKTLLGA
jgi:hypothetical protein